MTHQTAVRYRVANKAINVSAFDHVDVRKNFVEINRNRYPKVSVNIKVWYQRLFRLIERSQIVL